MHLKAIIAWLYSPYQATKTGFLRGVLHDHIFSHCWRLGKQSFVQSTILLHSNLLCLPKHWRSITFC